MQGELTKEEKSWLRKVQNLLDECPSDRIGFFTTGDKDVSVYDCSRKQEIDELELASEHCYEYCQCISEVGADLGSLTFPNQVLNLPG
jgi:hypothetical protein